MTMNYYTGAVYAQVTPRRWYGSANKALMINPTHGGRCNIITVTKLFLVVVRNETGK